jgi:DNA repair protein RecO (recombination protein O)
MAARPRSGTSLPAYVLHRYDWSESSLVLDLLTRELGRIAVVAKGAKRPYSQLRAVLLPFQRIAVALGRPANPEAVPNIHTLRAAEWDGGGGPMLSGAALFSGFYLNELLMKLLARGDPHPALFDAYAETLVLLGGGEEARVEAALRGFELTLLREMGVLPDLSLATATQQPVDAAVRYTVAADHGVAEALAGDSGIDGAALVQLQAALEHCSLAALHVACGAVLPELKGLLRAQLHYHLGSGVLRTRQVMVQAQNLERQA